MRKYYQRRYPSDSSKDYYFIHRNTGNTEAVIVEYGFLDNINDANLLKKYWEDYAEAVVKAIANYLGIPYTFDGSLVNENYYIVKKGDSLWSIANKYGLTVDKLKDINNLSSNMLSIGQKLLINDNTDVDNTNENYYVVKSGDTLYSIAKKYGLTIDELKEMNNLNSNTLSINQKLLVGKDAIKSDKYDVYVVKSGDTLWSIASKYNTTVDNIKKINNLNTNLLTIGQKLLVPMSSINKIYIVKSGDTLYKIAQNNNTTVTDIINLNNLSTTNLSIGQVLYLP